MTDPQTPPNEPTHGSYPPPDGPPLAPSPPPGYYGQAGYPPGYGMPGYGAPGYGAPGYGMPGYGAPGYGAPPPTYGYLPEPEQTAPPGYLTNDERTWAMLGPLLAVPVGFIGPLIVMLTKGKESPFVRDQSVEALNFQLTLLIVYGASFVLGALTAIIFIGIFILLAGIIALPIIAMVFEILHAVAANKGTAYRYPINLRMVR